MKDLFETKNVSGLVTLKRLLIRIEGLKYNVLKMDLIIWTMLELNCQNNADGV